MKIEVWDYSWGSWEARISKHPIRNEYIWSVEDADGNDMYDFYSHLDVELSTPQAAENDMFFEIHNRIGHQPTKQLN